MRPDPDSLSHTFLAHLRREEETLQASHDVLSRVRDALLRCDLNEFIALQEQQQRADATAAQVRQERHRLRSLLADALGFATSPVSFSQLTAALPGIHSESLRGAGERLRRLVSRVDQIVQSNATLVGHFVDVSRRFLFELTGGEDIAGWYGRDGTHREASFGPVFSTRG